MTTFARGMSAPKRGVGAFFGFVRAVIDQQAITVAEAEVRSVSTADAAERHAIRREQARIEQAAMAAIRMFPRG
jgi:hypothetical protein